MEAVMDLFNQLESKYGLPSGLLDAVWSAESGRGRAMVSPAGAQGHFQFMPKTAQQYGLDDPNDLTKSAGAAARMFSDLLKQTGGDIKQALAGYNWGIGNVQRKGMDSAPTETRNYIQKVSASMGQKQDDPWAALDAKYSGAKPTQQQGDPWDELDKKYAAPAAARTQETSSGGASGSWGDEPQQPGKVTSFAAGVGKGVGDVALGAQHYVGKGVKALGDVFAPERKMSDLVTGNKPQNLVQQAGQWLLDDAAQGREKLKGELAPYKTANPITAGAGELGGNIAATWPVGGLLANGVRAAGGAVGASRLVDPLANSIASGGMRIGPTASIPGSIATRAAGGAISGGVSAGLVDPNSAGTGAIIGGVVPLAIRGTAVAGNAVGNIVKDALRPSMDASTRTILKAAGAETPAQIAAVRSALSTPRPSIVGESLTVPQILQTPGVSQLGRTVHNAGNEALLNRAVEQNAQRLGALDRVSPVTGTTQQAASQFGDDLERFAIPANDRAKQAVGAAYDAIDPNGMTAFRLPVGEMRGARDQFLGRGTFGTGKSANQAIDTAAGLTTTHGVDPATGAAMTVDRLSPYQEVQNLRSSIGEAATTAKANGANKEHAALTQMIKAIDSRLDDVAAGRGAVDEVFPADVVAQWRKANDMHAARLDRFETGPQSGMWRLGGDSQVSVQGGELASKFFNAARSQAEDIAAFNRLAGNDFSPASLKNYAITDLASKTDQMGNLSPAQIGKWVDARSGAINGLFSEQEQATIRGVRESLDRAFLAENLGKATGSNTAQNLQSTLGLGLLHGKGADIAANRIPLLKHVSGPLLEGLRVSSKNAKVRELGGLLSDPKLLEEAIAELQRRGVSRGLLDVPESTSGLLGLSVRAAPLLSTGR